MKIGMTVTVKRKGDAGRWFTSLRKRLTGPDAIKVGYPAGSGRHSSSLVDIAQIAIWNHYGTAGGASGGGWGGPIPPRPFITVAVFKNRRQVRRMLRDIWVDILNDRTTAAKGLEEVGQFMVEAIKREITHGSFAPNSPLTIRLKGSSRPLVDTGEMRNATRWVYDGAGSQRSSAYRVSNTAGKAFGRALRRLFGK